MIQSLKLILNEVMDRNIRENFSRIERYFRNDPLRKLQAVFFEYEFRETSAYPLTVTVPHNFNFPPLDVIQLSVTEGAVISWDYDSFTRDNITLTSDKACRVRALIGRYAEV